MEGNAKTRRATVHLSSAQSRFLEGRRTVQDTVLRRLEKKGLRCTLDMDKRMLYAESKVLIDSAHVSSELEGIIVEHELDVSPDQQELLAVGADKSELLINETLVIRDAGKLKIVGLSESVDLLKHEQQPHETKTKQGSKMSVTDYVQISEECNAYLYKYKHNLVCAANKKVQVRFVTCAGQCPYSVEISGPSHDVINVKDKIRTIVQGVVCTKYVFGVKPLLTDKEVKDIVKDIAKKNKCVVNIELSAAHCNWSTPDDDAIWLSRRGEETTVAVVFNEIQKQAADAIINTVHKNLTLGVGRVSTTLLKACGNGVQADLRANHPDGIEHGDIAVTDSGNMVTCEKIYHGALPAWKGLEAVSMDTCFESMLLLVNRCLIEASTSGHSSIALPALGTGALEYPFEDVAHLMFKAVRLFLQQNFYTPIKTVYFVIYPWSSRELKQIFLANSITQGVETLQIESSQVERDLHGVLRESLEVMFRVGKTLVKVVNAEFEQACHQSCPLLVLSYGHEAKEVAGKKTSLGPDRRSDRVLIHTLCPGETEEGVTRGVKSGLESAKKAKRDTLSLYIPRRDKLTNNPESAAISILKAIKKCSSCVFVFAVFIPDKHVFSSFVTEAGKCYISEKPPKAHLVHLVENTWKSLSLLVPAQIQGILSMLPTEDRALVNITSDSEEKNKDAAKEIQKALCD